MEIRVGAPAGGDDTDVVQAAIDRCHAGGGGRVVLPAGDPYVTGTVRLRDNVELHLERGAVLAASGRWDDFAAGPAVSGLSSGTLGEASAEGRALLWARGATNIAVTGGGTIDGGGRHYVAEDLGEIYRMPVERPFTIFFLDCDVVTVRDVRVTDAAYWTLRFSRCRDVVVDGVRIRNDLKLPNNDGIDLDWCQSVRVANCDIDTGDDAISVKTCDEFDGAGACEDIVVANCTLRSRSSGVVIGCDLVGPVRRVAVTGCAIRSSHRGLAVNLSQKGSVEGVVFSDCVVETGYDDDAWWGNGEPVYVSAEAWHDDVGTIRAVRARNLWCRSENGVTVQSVEPGLVSDVHLDGVSVDMGAWTGRPGGRLDLRPSARVAFVDRPTAAFQLDNATGVSLSACRASWTGDTPPWLGQALQTVGGTPADIDRFDARGWARPRAQGVLG